VKDRLLSAITAKSFIIMIMIRGDIEVKKHVLSMSVLVACLLVTAYTTCAEEPVPPVTGNTLWHWLGIPQGCNKIKDARLNRSGDNPNRERTPPLKRIADPSNLEAQNPAIKTAAKIKTEEDLAPQKIKAIKYLATIGCGCYPGVRDALLAALSECNEEVRYEAAIALCQVAGNPCKNCDKTGCCNAEVMNKLNEMAYGQDAKGCCIESSARVRQAAANALNACRRKNPTTSLQPIPQRTPETPEEPAGSKEMPSEPNIQGPSPTPAPLPPSSNQRYAPPSNNLHLTGMTREVNAPEGSDSTPGMAIVANGSNAEGIAEQVSFLRWGDRCRKGYVTCPQQQICPEQPHPATPGETPAPPAQADNTPGDIAAAEPAIPPSNALASDFGATSGPLSSAPNMIGDFFGGAGVTFLVNNEPVGTAPLPGNATPRFKMAENTSPIPQDRLYFDYNFYSNVPLTESRSNVNSFAPGFEKTFFNGNMSVEMRVPMATTLSNGVYFDGSTSTSSQEFGNMGVAIKSLILQREKFLLSGGLAMSLPTAQNSQYFLDRSSTNSLLSIDNQSVHLMPFLGGLWTPNDRWFGIGYLQVDVDANGDPVTGTNPFSTPNPTFLGRYHDTTFMYADLGLGYWARRSHDSSQFFTGLAYVLEFHLNQSLQSQQVLVADAFQIGTPAQNVSFSDLTVGTHIELYKHTTITAAFITPLTPDRDRQFDGQFRLFVNRCF
jgi:hypothetical protein